MKVKLLAIILSNYAFSQIGIGTVLPKSKLDVEGDIILRNSLRVGGNDLTKGNAGLKDQVLVSQGVGMSPTWKYVNVPFMENGQYKLINTYVIDDNIGIKSITISGVNYLNKIGDQFDSSWTKISGLKTIMEIKSSENKTTYQFQTGVESVTTSSVGEVKFMCGIFKDNTLVALRPDKITTITTNSPMQYMYTLNYTEENTPIGSYSIEMACRGIEGNSHTLSIGTNTTSSTDSNNFQLKSFLKIDLAELITFKANR